LKKDREKYLVYLTKDEKNDSEGQGLKRLGVKKGWV